MKKIIALSTVGVLCWVTMFLAGTDVWHFAGSPDFWRLSVAPYADLRVFAYAFYGQFFVLLTAVALGVWSLVRTGRTGKETI